MDKGQEILRRLETIHNLPTLPVVVTKLREVVNNPNADAKRVAAIIEDDPAMMARILKVVNSALYRGRQDITSLQMAVARMGFNAISNIAMSTTIFSIFKSSQDRGFDHAEFWRHCICVGIGADIIYERCRDSLQRRYTSDILHLAGLLHDIGKIVFEQFFHATFRQAVNLAVEESIPLCVAEWKIMGVDHAELGAVLAQRWHLTAEFANVIRWHHAPVSVNINEDHAELIKLIHTADYICNLERIGDGGNLTAPAFDQKVWGSLGLGVADISEVVDEIKEKAKHSEVLMSFV